MAAPATKGVPFSVESCHSSIPQTKFREITLQILFAMDVSGQEDEVIPMVMREVRVSKRHVLSAFSMASAVIDNKNSLDDLLRENIEGSHQEKVSRLEKNVLRLICYERFSANDSPAADAVLISEAIRLTKKFGHPPASAFVHAVLDSIFQKNHSLTFTRISFPSNLKTN
ncbi:transcription antitermination factor NusB [Chlamydiifrater volucris]|uniref:transcription antitermination factor NusB n=1 Tax=Chlamydiifrater volucris TaxID=2681470 RepID=UPI001BCBDC20|nr:transcription antitermination factor NusB [Chlamydiifrater volucris]